MLKTNNFHNTVVCAFLIMPTYTIINNYSGVSTSGRFDNLIPKHHLNNYVINSNISEYTLIWYCGGA